MDAGTGVVRRFGQAVDLLRPDAPTGLPTGSGKSEFLLRRWNRPIMRTNAHTWLTILPLILDKDAECFYSALLVSVHVIYV